MDKTSFWTHVSWVPGYTLSVSISPFIVSALQCLNTAAVGDRKGIFASEKNMTPIIPKSSLL